MNILINLIFIELAFNYATGGNRPRLTAVSYSLYAGELYNILRTKGAPSASDPATSTDPQVRRDICWDASHSGFFRMMMFYPIGNQEIRRGWKKSKYDHLFSLMYDGSFKYTNPYRRIRFNDNSHEWRDYAFICVLRNGRSGPSLVGPIFPYVSSDQTIPFYITKEYNVGLPGQPYKPGRFMFGSVDQSKSNHLTGRVEVHGDTLLMEEAAKIYTQPDFNAELYYLQIRKYTNPVEENMNPLCILVSEHLEDPVNQHQRLCAAALSQLSFFEREQLHIELLFPKACKEEELIFKTENYKESYSELMVACTLRGGGPSTIKMFMSRGYKSNDVFIYREHNKKIYLEGLSSGVTLIDELNSFDFVED